MTITLKTFQRDNTLALTWGAPQSCIWVQGRVGRYGLRVEFARPNAVLHPRAVRQLKANRVAQFGILTLAKETTR